MSMSTVKRSSVCCLLITSLLSTVLAAYVRNEQEIAVQRFRRAAIPPASVLGHQLSWDGIKPAARMDGMAHDSTTLTCQAGGSPPPTIHWLKNGVIIGQDNFETTKVTYPEEQDNSVPAEEGGPSARLGMSSTRSRLFLDCLTGQDTAIYTCVAETPYQRISTDTKLVVSGGDKLGVKDCVEKRSAGFGKPARITMWTNSRIELSGADVKLFCRASGSPAPSVSWERESDTGLDPIQNDYRHKILPNGDLIIRKVNFEDDMGGFVCVAQNSLGKDQAATFLYPTTL